jgi:hypothetical protein
MGQHGGGVCCAAVTRVSDCNNCPERALCSCAGGFDTGRWLAWRRPAGLGSPLGTVGFRVSTPGRVCGPSLTDTGRLMQVRAQPGWGCRWQSARHGSHTLCHIASLAGASGPPPQQSFGEAGPPLSAPALSQRRPVPPVAVSASGCVPCAQPRLV